MWRRTVELPPGYSLSWSGQYEYIERVQEKLSVVAPATLLIITLMLFHGLQSRNRGGDYSAGLTSRVGGRRLADLVFRVSRFPLPFWWASSLSPVLLWRRLS